MFHLKAVSWSSSAIVVFSKLTTQQQRMASSISYSRKRSKGAATLVGLSGSTTTTIAPIAASVDGKHKFDEFRHVASVEKKLESIPRKERKGKEERGKQEEEEVLVVHEDRILVKDEIGSSGDRELKPSMRPDVVTGEGGCEALLKSVDEMVVALAPLTFKAPVAFVYNPLDYARSPHEEYLRTYGGKKVDVLLVGMNPGPFGMAQTGVPFGDSVLVREFLHIKSEVEPPKEMHPKRPIVGLKCPRREVSGQRVWGWAQARFGTARTFLDRFWIHNYCPLMFMESSGKNRTPDKLTVSERASIISICNIGLRSVIEVTNPRLIVGIDNWYRRSCLSKIGELNGGKLIFLASSSRAPIRLAPICNMGSASICNQFGKYAVERAKECAPPGVRVGYIMHPSPANPKANKDWDKLIEAQLRDLGVDI